MKKIRRINEYISRKQGIVILFPAAFIVGVIIGIIVSKISALKSWVESCCTFLKDVSVVPSYFLLYVMWKRMKQFVFIFLLCFLKAGPFLYCIYMVCGCISFGVIFSCFCSINGIAGVLIAFLSFMPHYIFYCFFLYWGYDLFNFIWSGMNGTDLHSQSHKGLYLVISGVKVHLGVVLVVVAIMGVVTECYVNPFLLKFFANFLMG